MADSYKRTITTYDSGGAKYIPATSGAYALRVSPYTSNAYVGTHEGNGVWNFGTVTQSNSSYRMYYSADSWATSSQVTSFGEFPIDAGIQANENEVIVFAGASTETGIVYSTIASAIASFTSPASDYNCNVIVTGTGDSSEFITISHASLVSYVHITGRGKFINIILGVTGNSVNKVMTISNCSIWMGGADITTDRSYINFTFDNCDIYAYKSITFEDCNLNNCRIFQPSGEDITLSKATIMTNCILTQTLKPTFTGNGFLANVTDEALTTYSMITDPTI